MWRILPLILTAVLVVFYVVPYAALLFPELGREAARPSTTDHVFTLFTTLIIVAAFTHYSEYTIERYAAELRDRTAQLDGIVGVDKLTRLPNRHRLYEDANGWMVEGSKACLFLIDVNDFKIINDRYSHAEGDAVLVEVASRLSTAIGEECVAYRLGGDEFVITIHEKAELSQAEFIDVVRNKIDNIEAAMKVRVQACESSHKVSLSIGVARYPQDAETLDELQSFADKAMYQAKTGRTGFAFFEEAMAIRANEASLLRERLSLALEREEFLIHYQPQVEIHSGRIVGAEALIRWQVDGEIISPLEFIPCLEKTGKIVEVGHWAMRTACRQAHQWQAAGYDLRVSLNVSALQIQSPSFAADTIAMLKECDLSGAKLDIEISETMLVEDNELCSRNLLELAQHGVTFSIDDFGTGFSSLAYLRQMPVNRLKIDRAFIKDYPDSDDGVFAATVVSLAKHLNMEVVAEGVNNQRQLDFLRDLDCEEYQGYHFSKPLDVEELSCLLEESRSSSTRASKPQASNWFETEF